MGMRINTNIDALTAQRNLSNTAIAYSQSVQKLSSGLRINSAADDAAGLSISEKIDAQVKGLNQASRTAQDGISMVQTAEGALNETQSILQRMRELSVQAGNGTLTSNDEGAISSEMTALNSEINRIATTTQFNSKVLLTGGLSTTECTSSGVLAGLTGGSSATAISNVDVSNAAGGHTFTFTGCAPTKTLTLTDGTTNLSQTLSVADITGSTPANETLNFSTLGVSVTVSGCSASSTGDNIVSDLITDATVVTNTGGSATFQIGAI